MGVDFAAVAVFLYESVLSQHGAKTLLLGGKVKAAKKFKEKNTSLILSSLEKGCTCLRSTNQSWGWYLSQTLSHHPPPSFQRKKFRNLFHHFFSHPGTLFPKFESMLVRSCHDFTYTLPVKGPRGFTLGYLKFVQNLPFTPQLQVRWWVFFFLGWKYHTYKLEVAVTPVFELKIWEFGADRGGNSNNKSTQTSCFLNPPPPFRRLFVRKIPNAKKKTDGPWCRNHDILPHLGAFFQMRTGRVMGPP